MVTRKKQPVSKFVGLFATSEDRVNDAGDLERTAGTTVVNAWTYGTEAHAAAARQVYMEAAESYAEALRIHAHLVMDYARENP